VEGWYCVNGQAVELVDLEIPIFAVGTERDHVSPWRSVYKLHLLTGAEISFPLTSGGHNSRIISEPSRRTPLPLQHTQQGCTVPESRHLVRPDAGP